MKHKPTLFVIIILLIIAIPASIYGITKKNEKKAEEPVNLTYTESTLNELDKNVNIYKNGTKIYLDNFIVNGKEYNFVKLDDNKNWLYSVKDNIKVLDYEAINFYNTDIENDYVLVKREGKWGILNTKTLKPVAPCEYNYIGLINNVVDGKLKSNTFIGSKNNSYSIYKIDTSVSAISNTFSDLIYTYNENQKLIATVSNDTYSLYDFEGNKYLQNIIIKDISINNNHITIIDSNNTLYVYNNILATPVLTENLNSYKDFYTNESTKLEIYIDGTLYKTVEN